MSRPFLAALCALMVGFTATQAHAQNRDDIQSGVLMDSFMKVCASRAGNTDAAIAAANKAGWAESSATSSLEATGGPSLKIFFRTVGTRKMKLVLGQEPWSCMMSSPGTTYRGMGEAQWILEKLLLTEEGNEDVQINRKPRGDGPEEIDTVVSLNTEDGAQEVYTTHAGGTTFPNSGVFKLEYRPPIKVPEFTAAFTKDFLPKVDDTDKSLRNSQMVLTLFRELCMYKFGDFDGVNQWAAGFLKPDERFSAGTEKLKSWAIADRFGDFALRVSNKEDKSFCTLTGGPVDANAIHDGFKLMQNGWSGPGGYSVSEDAFTGREYDMRPNNMPNDIPYYSGAVFHSPQYPDGFDVIVWTKAVDDVISMSMEVKKIIPAGQQMEAK